MSTVKRKETRIYVHIYLGVGKNAKTEKVEEGTQTQISCKK